MVDLLLVRHGESEWNALGRWQGHADPPLSPLGERQAAHAGRRVASLGVERVTSSDLVRAARTAAVIAETLGLPLDPPLPAVRERAAGAWEGLTHAEIEDRWPGHLQDGRRPEGFEGDDALLARVVPALLALAAREARWLVVTHGGVLRALERRHGLTGPRIPNLGGRWWHVVGGALDPGDPVVLVDPDEVTRPEET